MTLAGLKDGAGILAIGVSLLSPIVIAVLSKTFSRREDHLALARKVAGMAERLAAGEARFAQLEGAIKAATQAAAQAKIAAEEATIAAAKVHGTEIACARLEERIAGLSEALENLEHFTRLMVEGQLKLRA